jgi:hypothetical protein
LTAPADLPRADSYRVMKASGGVLATAHPITSRGRSSAVSKRMHDLPMSSFLPAFAKPSRIAFSTSGTA